MSRVLEIVVPDDKVGLRLDVFISTYEEISTRSAAQKLIAEGNILLKGRVANKNHRVKMGEVFVCHLHDPEPSEAIAEEIPLDIAYEDNDLLVVNKPRGLVIHPAVGNFTGTLVNALLHHCKGKLSGIGGVKRPGIVHRLDKDTSGLMVVAKNDITHSALSAQLSNRTMGRVYQAIVIGTVKKDEFTINEPIGRHTIDRKKMAVIKKHGVKSRNAVTHIKVLERFAKKFTLIEAKLTTGRTHQIRVHMAHVGYPIMGDIVYGNSRQVFSLDKQVLHAKKISFTHPSTGETMDFESDLPDYFHSVLEKIK